MIDGGVLTTAAVTTTEYRGEGDLALAADVTGPVDGQPVLLLHGGGQTRSSWKNALPAIAEAGYRAVAIDQRGHGDSAWSPDGRYSLDLFAADLRAVIATFDRPPVVIGASLGGLAGLLALGEDPKAPAAALVLVDIVPWMEERGGQQVVGFMRGTSGGFDTLEAAADAIADYLPHRPRPERLDGLARNLRKKADGRWYWHWDPAFVRPREGWDRAAVNDRLTAAARALPQPVMLVHGTNSEIVSKEGAARLATVLPDAEIVAIEGAHHMVAGDDNDGFLGALLPFLERWQVTA